MTGTTLKINPEVGYIFREFEWHNFESEINNKIQELL